MNDPSSPFIVSPPSNGVVTTEWLLRAHQDSALVDRVSKEFSKAYAALGDVSSDHVAQTKKLQTILDDTMDSNKELKKQNTKLVEMCETSLSQVARYKTLLEDREKSIALLEKHLKEQETQLTTFMQTSETKMRLALERIEKEKDAEISNLKEVVSSYIESATKKQDTLVSETAEELKLTKCSLHAAAEARNECLREENLALKEEIARLKAQFVGLSTKICTKPLIVGTRHDLSTE